MPTLKLARPTATASTAEQPGRPANDRDTTRKTGCSIWRTYRRIEEQVARRRELIAEMAKRHSMPVPAEDRSLRLGTRPAFPLEHAHLRAAIVQSPKPEIPPSPWIQERLAGRELDREAAD
jgi:hypothetical protein